MWIICIIAFFVAATIVFFRVPYSITKNSFQNDVQSNKNTDISQSEVFSEQDIALLPEPIQNYFRVCGYIGKPQMATMTSYITSATLKDSDKSKPMIVDYTWVSFAHEPVRLAYIESSMYGIPFEAYDSLQNGVGFMKGVIGKVITLFDQRGPAMDKAQLLTYLGECFIIPSSVLTDYITWEYIDADHVKATITYKEISGSGIFTFDDKGFVEFFHTDERARIGADGKVDYPTWLCLYENYSDKNGIFYPESIKAVWRDESGDFVYFAADNVTFTFQTE